MQFVQDDEQTQITPVAVFLIIFYAEMIIFFTIKWRNFSFSLNDIGGSLNYVHY